MVWWRRWPRYLACCAPLLAPAVPPTPAAVGSASGWVARVEVPGEFQLLAARGGVLYSDRGGPALTNIVRLDPGNGRLLAKSPQLLAVSGFVFDDGLLWALAGSGTPGRPGNAVLIGLDPRTLRKERSIGLPTSSVSPPVAAPGAEIWLVAGCHLLQVGLQPGKILRSFPLGPGGGCISRLAVDGDRLYVAGPQVATDRLLLQERLASDGQVVSQGIVPDAPLGVNVAAADGYLWAAGGPPGANGSLFLYRTSPLRLVGSTGTEGGNGPLPGGPQMRRLPGFGQFPDVNISGG